MSDIAHILQIKDFLKTHPLGTLATIGADGLPEMSVLYFFIDDTLSCYFVTKTATRKFDNITTNQNGAIIVYDESSLTSVELAGTLSVLTDAHEVLHCITEFQKIASTQKLDYWVPPASQIDGTQFAACKLTPRVAYFKDFATKVDGSEKLENVRITL